MPAMTTNLNNNQKLAISLMITGMTSTDIARQLKIRKETVSRWKNNDLFKEELRRSRLEFMDKLLQSQLSLVKLSQQSIENALTSDTLA